MRVCVRMYVYIVRVMRKKILCEEREREKERPRERNERAERAISSREGEEASSTLPQNRATISFATCSSFYRL